MDITQQQWPEPRGLRGNERKISQAGAVQPVASGARRLHDDSSCWQLPVGRFGSQVPSMEGLMLGLFLLGRSRCWDGWQLRGSLGVMHC